MARRIGIYQTTGGSAGGGPGVIGNVVWGPYFGGLDGDEFTVGSRLSLPSLKFAGNRTCACSITMPTVDLEASQTTGVHMSGSILGAPVWLREDHNSAQNLFGGDTDITVTYAAGAPANGVLLLAFVTGFGSGLGVLTPTGWTQVNVGTAGSRKSRVFYKFASGESTSQMFEFISATSSNSTAEIHQLNLVDSTTPINASAVGNASVADPVVPGVTTTVANCMVFYFVMHTHAVTQSHTPPASNTEITEYETAALNSGCANSGRRTFATAGATETATVNCNQVAASDAVYHRIAIAPGPLQIAA